MDDQLDVPLEDNELLAEVELTTNLIIAASESDGPLSLADIDRILGITHGPTIPAQSQQQVRQDASVRQS